ncbi:hypothetical protein [Sulfuriroseicoccus oceanibius]|uniref:Uncharacterized protein n=1 Tax=Sulfuriroseicoccus oceanibius TaxID=2707525 RepID=A0A6B3L5I7_9BACT|nr:hypothetical protein [Sulfuriroseicoccus oceanibius]QQL44230.1 hypothetical protein G3M56_010025 [Sulfuriroseicoccus oceanibius]
MSQLTDGQIARVAKYTGIEPDALRRLAPQMLTAADPQTAPRERVNVPVNLGSKLSERLHREAERQHMSVNRVIEMLLAYALNKVETGQAGIAAPITIEIDDETAANLASRAKAAGRTTGEQLKAEALTHAATAGRVPAQSSDGK